MKSGLPIDVHDLLQQRGVESLRLEYKADWNHVCAGAVLQTAWAALATASAGLPAVLGRLVAELHVEQDLSPDGVNRALDTLQHEPGDLLGLVERAGTFTAASSSWKDAERALLDAVARREPLPRAALVAQVSSHRPGAEVRDALRSLELDGWLVEVDGGMRFEHPLIGDAWRALSAGDARDDEAPC